MSRTLLQFVFCLLPFIPSGAVAYSSHAETTADSLYKIYLSDTLNASVKIDSLVSHPNSLDDAKDPSIMALRFQLALALAPYAQDSVRTLARLYAQFSGWLFDAGATNLAIQYAQTALAYGKKSHPENPVRTYHLDARLATYYGGIGRYDSAKKYYHDALNDAGKIENKLWLASAINNLGFLYEKMNLPDSALTLFFQARQNLELKNHDDSDLLGGIQDNIAQNYFKRNRIDDAMKLYENNNSLYATLGNAKKLLQARIGISNCLLARKDFRKAFRELENIEELYLQTPSLQHPLYRLQILNANENYFSATGNWKVAMQVRQRADSLADSTTKVSKTAVDNIIRAFTENEVSKVGREIQMQQQLLSQEKGRARQNLVVALMVALLAAAIVFQLVLYIRNRNRVVKFEKEITQKELENKKLEQEKLQQEIKYRKDDLHDLGVYLSEIKDLHENIINRLREAKTTDPVRQKDVLKEIVKELDSKTSLQDRATLIQQNIDRVNAEFYDNLLRKYPLLTKSEMELCAFLKLNLTNKEIGVLKKISPDSVKMARNRLRKKIGLLPDDDIYAFVSKI